MAGTEAVRLVQPYLDGAETQALGRAGYGGTVGVGARAALLVVDVTWAFCGDDPRAEVLEAVEKYPHASGRFAWDAMPGIRELVDGARLRDVPVVFTRGPETPGPASRWEDKNRRQREAPPGAGDIVPESGFLPGDVVLHKEAPSAFFGTPLLRWLTGLGVDTVIVCGGTTSGCVRATVVDAFSHNLKTLVALDGTFDRVQASHRVGLFDMDLKYADVLPAAQILELLPAARVGDARSSSAPSRPSAGGDPAGPVPEVGTAPRAGGG
jgi:nicotinamidase-related amidase